MALAKRNKRRTQRYVLGKGWVNVYRPVSSRSFSRGYSKTDYNRDYAYYQSVKNANAIAELRKQPPPAPAPAPAPAQNSGGGGGQIDALAQQIQAQLDANAKQKAIYDEMIDDLNKRIEEAAKARPTTGINVITGKDVNKDVEQQTTKRIKPRKQLLAIESEEEDMVDTDTAAFTAGTGINLGI